MKILSISNSDIDGGAAIANYRLVEALRTRGIQVLLKVSIKVANTHSNKSSNIIDILNAKLFPRIELLLKLIFGIDKRYPWSFNLFDNSLVRNDKLSEVNLVHLGWVGKNTISLKDINGISAPIVWTLHDCWAFTGGCHLPGICKEYMNKCENCIQAKNKIGKWAVKKLFVRKNKYLASKEIYYIAPSNFMKNIAIESTILKKSEISVIPNIAQ